MHVLLQVQLAICLGQRLPRGQVTFQVIFNTLTGELPIVDWPVAYAGVIINLLILASIWLGPLFATWFA